MCTYSVGFGEGNTLEEELFPTTFVPRLLPTHYPISEPSVHSTMGTVDAQCSSSAQAVLARRPNPLHEDVRQTDERVYFEGPGVRPLQSNLWQTL